MKWFFSLTLVISFLVMSCFAKEDKENEGESFAVVELFTSEGCSSCPPADVLLGEITRKADANHQPIFTLAFHVDYWDYIGWKDPYANKAFSDRQRKYAQAFNSNRIYTPQMIVNGKTEFVGSNRRVARESIESALKNKAKFTIDLTRLKSRKANQVNIQFQLSGLPKNAVLNLALVERGLSQNVRRGENSGKTLKHENVVRAFKTLKIVSTESLVAIEIPTEVNLSKCSIIGYIQNDYRMEILGANAIAL